MTDAVIDEIDGRMIRIGDHWLADFASCNYLGFDLDREIIDSIPAYLEKWGTHPSWSRLLGSPVLYEQIEERLTDLLGAPDALVLPTITLIHLSVIPLLAASGTVFVDRRAHKTIYEGAELATLRGATLQALRARRPRRARVAAACRHIVGAPHLHRRRQQHDRQRRRSAGVRDARARAWRDPLRRRRARLRRDRRAERRATRRRTAAAATASSATAARPTRTSCSSPASRRHTRPSPRSSPARPR